ncbi:MAG: rod shape-determining protein MreD [Bacteroidales bacterium]|nr:rod shape-determining protein MreD [Bacteroidales bacterium]
MIIQQVIRFILMLLLQVLVFNHILIGAYIYPSFYIYFILLLPFETKGWVLLLSAFLIGLGVDFFSNSLGMHAGASVFMAFCRPAIIRMLTAGKENETGSSPGMKSSGFSWFLTYSFLLTLLHHSMLFLLEVFGFSDFKQTLFRIILSTIATMILVILAQLIFYKQDKR